MHVPASARRGVPLARAQLALVAAFAASMLVSIFASQIFLALALLVLFGRLVLRRTTIVRTSLDRPILAFSLWTLLSASFSVDPGASHEHAKKLLLVFVFALAIDTLASERNRERVLNVSLFGGLALSGFMVLQYHLLGFDGLNNRPHGFLGHYMSASGLVMSVMVVAAARLAFGRERPRLGPGDGLALCVLAAALTLLAAAHASGTAPVLATRLFVLILALAGVAMVLGRAWPGPATGALLATVLLPLGTWALLVSRTRNTWLGVVAGLGVVILLRAPKALWLLAAGVGVILVVRPPAVVERLTLTDASSVDRYYMWQAGIDMIRDKPIFGQGPGMILRTYPGYRWPEAPNSQAPHLHDNALQLAAERGLPCLVFWLWWMVTALGDAWRQTRALVATPPRRGPGWVSVAALAVWIAVMAAGLFEYNLGDSEVLMFFLLISALPYARMREAAVLPASGAA